MILGSMMWTANAQTQGFGAGFHTQIQNATPIVISQPRAGARARIVRLVMFGTDIDADRVSE